LHYFLDQDIKFLTGVGPKRAEILNKELGIFTFRDLLYYFPYRHIDRSKFYSINELNADLPYLQIKGKIIGIETAGDKRHPRLVVFITDGTGIIELVFFKGVKYIREMLKRGMEYVVFGKPSIFNNKLNIIHPELEEAATHQKKLNTPFQPLYNTTEKMKNNFLNSKAIYKIVAGLVQSMKTTLQETLPEHLVKEYHFLSHHDAVLNIHFPSSIETLNKAQYRLKFEELFFIQISILRQRKIRHVKSVGLVFARVGDYTNNFAKNNLPFELTGAQKRVVKKLRENMRSGRQLNCLLQGDVGSGKTLVALICALIALDNNLQVCIMAPTEILANQHFSTFTKMLNGLDIRLGLLTGSTKKKVRTSLHEALLSGELQILIGTHALIEDNVQFKNLGFVVIDEQHKFGVAQRSKLWKKSEITPHVLVMTATPIPRTLQMTVLPPGRQKIETKHYTDALRMRLFGEIRKEIEKGRQVYVVYPMIEESEKLDIKYLRDGVESFIRSFPPPQYRILEVHGKMKQDEKNEAMLDFVNHRADILISTTVIEVGVDVPNATMMVIESAERFGLSQLHQLRGRVGRGGEKSVCILMTKEDIGTVAKKRMKAMCDTNDGFVISEIDLELRGPGNIEGTMQSGVPGDLKLANLARDGQIVQYARQIASKILDEDPFLEKAENTILAQHIQNQKKEVVDWGTIS